MLHCQLCEDGNSCLRVMIGEGATIPSWMARGVEQMQKEISKMAEAKWQGVRLICRGPLTKGPGQARRSAQPPLQPDRRPSRFRKSLRAERSSEMTWVESEPPARPPAFIKASYSGNTLRLAKKLDLEDDLPGARGASSSRAKASTTSDAKECGGFGPLLPGDQASVYRGGRQPEAAHLRCARHAR